MMSNPPSRAISCPLRVLFLCNQNRLRSPTAEKVFSGRPGLEVRSAGIDNDAVRSVSEELLEWADRIYVMEERQLNFLWAHFPEICPTKKITCLHIPDRYDYMEPRLVSLFKTRLKEFDGRRTGLKNTRRKKKSRK